MKLLITGASGLFGARLAQAAVNNSFSVYSAHYKHTISHGTAVKLDVTNKDQVEKTIHKLSPDVIVHSAALTNVDKCEEQKQTAYKTNVKATENIVGATKKTGSFLVYISTDYIFDGKTGMYKETDPANPVNYYGYTKLMAEKQVQTLNDYCIARPSVIYGSNPAAGKVNFALWLLNKLKNKEEVKIVTDQWNTPTLNTNLANMVLEILEQRLTGIYHLCGATRLSRYDFSVLLAQEFGLDTTLIVQAESEQFHWAAKRPRDSSLNTTKAAQTLKTKPLKIKQALKQMKANAGN